MNRIREVINKFKYSTRLNQIKQVKMKRKACSEEMMQIYSQEGRIKKRNLNTGDIIGIQKLCVA